MEPIAGFCPGSASVQCCVPEVPTPPPSNGGAERPYGAGERCNVSGQQGICGTPSDCVGGQRYSGYCPGDSSIQCCVEDNAQSPAPQGTPGLGQACIANGEPGVCARIQSCAGNPVAGYCAGDNSIQCCVEGDEKLAWFAVPLIIEGASLAVALYRGYRAARYVSTIVTTVRTGQAVRVGVYTGAQSVTRAQQLGYAGGRILEGRVASVVDNFYRAAALAAAAERLDNLSNNYDCDDGELGAYDSGRRDSGMCTPEDHCKMEKLKDAACQTPASCSGDDSVRRAAEMLRQGQSLPPTLHQVAAAWCDRAGRLIGNGTECVAWRQRINDECFNGGDAEHNGQIQERQNGIDNCERLFEEGLCSAYLGM